MLHNYSKECNLKGQLKFGCGEATVKENNTRNELPDEPHPQAAQGDKKSILFILY
jgi:hypothetical protein